MYFYFTVCFPNFIPHVSVPWRLHNVHQRPYFIWLFWRKIPFCERVAYATQCRVCNTHMSHMQHRVAYATHVSHMQHNVAYATRDCRIRNSVLRVRHVRERERERERVRKINLSERYPPIIQYFNHFELCGNAGQAGVSPTLSSTYFIYTRAQLGGGRVPPPAFHVSK